MIKRRRAKEDDYIGPSKGWAKFFHRLFLLVTFPLRKPLWTLLILFILFLLPTFRGVKPAEVHLWYWNLLKQSSAKVSVSVTDKAKELAAELPVAVEKEPAVRKAVVKVIDVPAKESRRKMFERAKSAPVVVIETTQTVEKPAAAPAKKKLNLVFLKEPETVSGTAGIINANELVVGGKEMFLFGIYADPTSDKGKAAEAYLREAVAGQNVTCSINAYTYQSIATAVCRVGTVNLNRELVERGFSKNVALD